MMDAVSQRWSALKLFDKVLIYFFSTLELLILIFHRNISYPFVRFAIYGGSIIFLIFVIPILDRSQNRIIHFARHWYIIAILTFIYWSVGHLVHMIFPGLFDGYIISFEESIFGRLPNVWVQQFENPFLTEIMQISYAIYWATVPVGAAIFYFTKRYKEFELMQFFTLVAFFISYLLFILIPVAGPRYMIADQIHASYKGIVVTEFLRRFVEGAGLHGGAFPSSHVAVAIVVLFFVWKYFPGIGKWAFLPAVIALSMATVYGQYHYLTDVVAGVAMGILIGWIGIRYSAR
jgi:membrane-associated phospholipid phosphatase